eukprot:CAMPEP_0172694106 /NCGR_PEP_ID=MMETSP1074-20121228/26472_1 /TAXON_ID=2916 /ORGANISM="Ceratium fusus, Strain PA161109" /LENGTH=141 /DNA_ID=CAMNT_0013514587 /DNA_START=251 /DNA_END=676 /DNA_ORIENTATION=+
MARNSRNPMPMSVYVKRSSFIDGLRAMPTTSAAKSWPIPCAQPPTATIAMAQPSTETPAWRLLKGSPRHVAKEAGGCPEVRVEESNVLCDCRLGDAKSLQDALPNNAGLAVGLTKRTARRRDMARAAKDRCLAAVSDVALS